MTKLSPAVISQLRKYCDDVVPSRIFELIRPNESESKLGSIQLTASTSSRWDTTEKIQRLKIREYENFVPMFPCFLGDGRSNHFYIAYGFNQGYVFVFKRSGPDSDLRVFGLVEPTPSIDNSFWNKRHLEKYFLQVHRKYNQVFLSRI